MMKKKETAILVSVIVVCVVAVLAVLFSVTSYVVEFDTAGGSRVAALKVKIFKKLTRPVDPVKEGYTFDNWYYNDGIFDFDTRITKDMVIEARWLDGSGTAIGSYTVSFNSNGGSSVASIKTNDDGTVNQPDDPVREGYKFVAWQYNGEDFDFGKKVTSNMTLVAKWEEASDAPSVPAEKVTLSPASMSLNVGNTRRISVTLSPKEATNRKMTWTTSNNKVATVDSNGNVRAVGVGSATITVSVDGKKASITVRVTQATSSGNNGNNGGAGASNPGNTTPPTNTTDPGTTTPEPEPEPKPEPETYTAKILPVTDSTASAGQVRIIITSSKGYNVAGYVYVTGPDGSVNEALIPADGRVTRADVVTSVRFSRLQ